MRLLLKQIWYRKRSAAWLFIELVLLSVMAYMMSEQIMRLYVSFFPRGYEADERVHLMYFYPKDEDMELETYFEKASKAFSMLESEPGVEKALLLSDFSVPAGLAKYNSDIYEDRYGDDVPEAGLHPALLLPVASPEDYGKMFSVFGIKVVEGTLENVPDNAAVLTEDLAHSMFPGGDAIGKSVSDGHMSYTVCAVASPLKTGGCYEFYSPCAFIFGAVDPEAAMGEVLCFAFVLEEGKDLTEFADYVEREIMPEDIEVLSVSDYAGVVKMTDSFATYFPDEDIWTAALMILLVFLGTVSYFWMNDRNSMDENGIRMSYGATRTALGGRYVLQAFILFTAAFLVAAAVVANIELISSGVFYMSPFYSSIADGYPFLESKWAALAIVSAVIYAVLLVVVLLATLLCAARLRGRTPVEMMHK